VTHAGRDFSFGEHDEDDDDHGHGAGGPGNRRGGDDVERRDRSRAGAQMSQTAMPIYQLLANPANLPEQSFDAF
jgi:hypothetical protein